MFYRTNTTQSYKYSTQTLHTRPVPLETAVAVSGSFYKPSQLETAMRVAEVFYNKIWSTHTYHS